MTPEQHNNTLTWIRALLSGEYEQGKFGLKVKRWPDDYRYCVLGVLCETAGIPYSAEEQGFLFNGKYEDSFVPEPWFHEFTGLSVPPARLQAMNDCNATFVALAAYLISFLPDGPEKLELVEVAGLKFDADLARHSHEEAIGEAA